MRALIKSQEVKTLFFSPFPPPLKKKGINAGALHGNEESPTRTETLERGFRAFFPPPPPSFFFQLRT